jgi:hypothetical protein
MMATDLSMADPFALTESRTPVRPKLHRLWLIIP